MSGYIKALLFVIPALFWLLLTFPVFAQGGGGGPAGVPLIEYMFARVVCVAVPLGYTALLVVLVIAGIKYLTSGGEAKAVQAAHQTVTWGLLGILFLALAWLILLLIQNFTGVEVTKFSVSSLPGVQGFTGSCWTQPPVAPEPPKPTLQTNQTQQAQQSQIPLPSSTTNSTNTSPSPEGSPYWMKPSIVTCSYVGRFSDYGANQCMVSSVCTDPSEFFTQIPPEKASFIAYDTSTFSPSSTGEGLRSVLTEPKEVFVMAGALDRNLYVMNEKLASLLFEGASPYSDAPPILYYFGFHLSEHNPSLKNNQWSIEKAINEGAVFGRYKKGEIPSELLSNIAGARRLAEDLDPRLKENFGTVVSLQGINCDDADYYSIKTISPLIYLYTEKPENVSLSVNSSIISPKLNLIGKEWEIQVSPNGIINTSDGNKYRYIPYEFLRNDFKRLNKGFLVEGTKLEEYLRHDLWKKLGLTEQEIEDYWQDTKGRVQSSSYYFISLIDRSEIDRILPMEVNPKPDTIIRNMTYILPLSSYPAQIPQPLNITTPKREGFTVLENGVFVDGF